jgi:hypothetical protein
MAFQYNGAARWKTVCFALAPRPITKKSRKLTDLLSLFCHKRNLLRDKMTIFITHNTKITLSCAIQKKIGLNASFPRTSKSLQGRVCVFVVSSSEEMRSRKRVCCRARAGAIANSEHVCMCCCRSILRRPNHRVTAPRSLFTYAPTRNRFYAASICDQSKETPPDHTNICWTGMHFQLSNQGSQFAATKNL